MVGSNPFPMVKEGDRLSASHVNNLSAIAKLVASSAPSSFNMGRPGHQLSFPKTYVRKAQIVAEDFALGVADGISGMYEIRFRYHDEQAVEDSSVSSLGSFISSSNPNHDWHTDEEGYTAFLDARVSGDSYSAGDFLSCTWDDQRGAWVPCGGGSGQAIVLFSNTSGEVLGSIPNYTQGGDALLGTGETVTMHYAYCAGVIFPGQGGLAAKTVDGNGNSFYYAITGPHAVLTGTAQSSFLTTGTITVIIDSVDYSIPVTNGCSDAIYVGNTVVVQAGGPGADFIVVRSCCP